MVVPSLNGGQERKGSVAGPLVTPSLRLSLECVVAGVECVVGSYVWWTI